jgi:hypothetical protein
VKTTQKGSALQVELPAAPAPYTLALKIENGWQLAR